MRLAIEKLQGSIGIPKFEALAKVSFSSFSNLLLRLGFWIFVQLSFLQRLLLWLWMHSIPCISFKWTMNKFFMNYNNNATNFSWNCSFIFVIIICLLQKKFSHFIFFYAPPQMQLLQWIPFCLDPAALVENMKCWISFRKSTVLQRTIFAKQICCDCRL